MIVAGETVATSALPVVTVTVTFDDGTNPSVTPKLVVPPSVADTVPGLNWTICVSSSVTLTVALLEVALGADPVIVVEKKV